MLSFLLFVFSCGLTIVLSLITKHSPQEEMLPSYKELTGSGSQESRSIWKGWLLLAVVMVGLYACFEFLARSPQTTEVEAVELIQQSTPPEISVYRGTTPVFDGKIGQDEYADAATITGIDVWTPQFSPVENPNDLSGTVWIKHDGEFLYFAFDITDDVLYGIDTERWLPEENPKAHELTRDGFPWFGDGVEVLINAENKWGEKDGELNKGNSKSWQMVASTHKSRLGGIGVPGLLEGEERSMLSAWNTYQKWILDKSMEVKIHLKEANEGTGYTVEWRIRPEVCLEISPGVFWSADLPKTQMGLNLAVGDLDFPESGKNNWGNFHHENWWAGEKDKRTWLKQWGTMTLYGGYKQAAVE